MKVKSIIFGLAVISLQFIFVPYFLIYLNSFFNLPTYSNLIFKILGLLLIIIGAAIVVYCFGLFKLFGQGTPVPIEPPKKLVIKGIYKYSRNPIYIAYLMILLGEFVFFGKLLLLLYPILIFFVINYFVVHYEEKELKKRFGKDYQNYCQKIPRWL